MRGGILFQPYPLVERVELKRGQDGDVYESILKLTFALEDPTLSLGFGQPTTHIKIRLPNSYIRSKAYSVASSTSEIGRFSIVIKVYRGGFMSGYLSRLQLGENAYIAQTLSKQVLESKNVGLIAFGIGITEMIHTAKDFLQEGRRVTLVHAMPHTRDVIFNEEFQQLCQEYPTTFEMIYFFSREECPSDLFPYAKVYYGRFDASNVEMVFDRTVWVPEGSRFLVIGTKSMMKNTYGMLSNVGYSQPLLTLPALF